MLKYTSEIIIAHTTGIKLSLVGSYYLQNMYTMSKKLTCERGHTQTYMMDGSVHEDGIITVTV